MVTCWKEYIFSIADQAGTDEFIKQLGELKVTEEEKSCVFHLKEDEVDKSQKKLENALLCKILTSKKINPEVFQRMMPKIWGQEHTIIKSAGPNMFLCKFRNAHIKGWIEEVGPWFYDRAMLLMEEPKGDSCGDELDFRYVSFWVHFHKLPFACFNRNSATEIGSLLGKVEQLDIDEEMDQCGDCSLRIKV